ncbi:MAG: hypothetical protein U0798_09735 [Gemmataceae bacterium]
MNVAPADRSFELPESARLNGYSSLDGVEEFADVRIGWNELGLAVQVSVRGKKQAPAGDRERPRSSDGLTIWIDTREDRTSHRASRYCHQFHLLAAGGGTNQSEPTIVQSKINRALQDAPMAASSAVPFRGVVSKGGYQLQAFLSADALTGFDPEQHPRLGIYTACRDQELGDQYLTVNQDFPFADDPSLWQILELVKD